MKKTHQVNLRFDDSQREFLDQLLISPNDSHGAIVRRLLCLLQLSPELRRLFERFQANEFDPINSTPTRAQIAQINESIPAVRNIASTVEALIANLSATRLSPEPSPNDVPPNDNTGNAKILRRMHAILEYLNTATALDLSDAPKEKSDAVLQATKNRLRAFYAPPQPTPRQSSIPAQTGKVAAEPGRASTSSKGV
ncbi:hypothetical protein SKA58_19585 [Sphingomonas sp. SKA58]|uniref:hypothetical protein n=1 Tax=Sphingomonas sp. (strain SKA58) TaxID=314266 RepID=UPI0000D7AE23|nr:hypothetical protein [Sphingomonas sp. SKA58]EAT07466.1 hypothetical protein SKA58_19585 [Sphingomonas sp. SKA58]